MIPVTNVRDFYAVLYDFVYVGYETTVLFVSGLDHMFEVIVSFIIFACPTPIVRFSTT